MFSQFGKRTHRRRTEPTVRRHIVYGVVACVCALLLGVGLWYVTRLPFLTIGTIIVEGGETIPHESLEDVVERSLSGSYLKLVPYRFIPLFPKEEIREALLTVPRVKEVSLSQTGTTLTVHFTEYIPAALWCSSAGDVCYFLDEVGYAFGESPQLEGGALVRFSRVDDDKPVRKQFMSKEEFDVIRAFLVRLQTEMGLRITEVQETNSVDLSLSINGGGSLRIEKGGDYDQAFKNLGTILGSKEFRHLAPGNFQYIDLRFGNKVFVNEEPIDTIGATSSTSTTPEGDPQ